jgi:hypothetical protein
VDRLLFTRETSAKLNGTRIFFKAHDHERQLFLAKAKTLSPHTIPITADSEIHLRSRANYIAHLAVENDQTDFTLVEEGNRVHFLVVQFAARRNPSEGARRTHLRFLCSCAGLPVKLVSLPLAEFAYELGFPMRSVKNTVLGDEEGHWHIALKKVGRDRAEIHSKVAVDPLWLFGIGIAVFLGKSPKR